MFIEITYLQLINLSHGTSATIAYSSTMLPLLKAFVSYKEGQHRINLNFIVTIGLKLAVVSTFYVV